MHEMSLVEGMVDLIEDAATRQGFSRVRTVWVEIGRLSSVEPDALRFAFDVVTRGTRAEGATLSVIDLPGTAWCLQCEASVDIPALYEACPRCGGYQLHVTGGTEMRVKELEVDD